MDIEKLQKEIKKLTDEIDELSRKKGEAEKTEDSEKAVGHEIKIHEKKASLLTLKRDLNKALAGQEKTGAKQKKTWTKTDKLLVGAVVVLFCLTLSIIAIGVAVNANKTKNEKIETVKKELRAEFEGKLEKVKNSFEQKIEDRQNATGSDSLTIAQVEALTSRVTKVERKERKNAGKIKGLFDVMNSLTDVVYGMIPSGKRVEAQQEGEEVIVEREKKVESNQSPVEKKEQIVKIEKEKLYLSANCLSGEGKAYILHDGNCWGIHRAPTKEDQLTKEGDWYVISLAESKKRIPVTTRKSAGRTAKGQFFTYGIYNKGKVKTWAIYSDIDDPHKIVTSQGTCLKL